MSHRPRTSQDYFLGQFRYDASLSPFVSEEKFHLAQQQFSLTFDDYYHAYFKKHGSNLNPAKSLIRANLQVFNDTYGHLPLAYMPCAISSGTHAHLHATAIGHFTTDRLSHAIGRDTHTRIIKDNSQRSLERIERIKDLFTEVFFIAPAQFEGSMRAFHGGNGRFLLPQPFQAGDYMALWFPIIDQTESLVIDDPKIDCPDIAHLEQEIASSKNGLSHRRPFPLMRTCDPMNSRNSIIEMMRGVYIAMGLHPLRPDKCMDLRIYSESDHRLYPATLLSCAAPLVQSMIRWGAQGIAVDTAARSLARLIHLHRARTSEAYNLKLLSPLDLKGTPQTLAFPTKQEREQFDRLIDCLEPHLLKYYAHLYDPTGLPEDYLRAQEDHPLFGKQQGIQTTKWQRKNIPQQETLDLWQQTLDASALCQPPSPLPSKSIAPYKPRRRVHDFNRRPFMPQENEIWPDRPFDNLDPMHKQLAEALFGVIGIVATNSETPEFAGLRYDMKRGERALSIAHTTGIADLSLLPGALGKSFAKEVRDPNKVESDAMIEAMRLLHREDRKKIHTIPAFGGPIISNIQRKLVEERKNFPGPGMTAPPSDFRLALEMEMLRAVYTTIQFQKNWETSEDSARVMLLASKIELNQIRRPGGNDTELKVFDHNGKIIPFADRCERLYRYLSILKLDKNIKRAMTMRDPSVLEEYGLRHTSLALARHLEIYDCLCDQDYNAGKFELRRVENLKPFSENLHHVSTFRDAAIREIETEWAWLWHASDFENLRPDYLRTWESIHGRQSMNAGPAPIQSKGKAHSFGPY